MCSLPQLAKNFPEVSNHDRLLQSFYSQLQTFFKDKGMFFASLITPVILLLLYAAFLANVYRDSFISALPEGFPAAEKLIGGIVGGQLVSSLLAVSCITVSFCCNMTMVLDKVTGARRDLTVSPVKKSTLALSYYLATFASTLLVCLIAAGAGFIYLAKVGWYLSFADVMLLFADIVLLVLFGTALSSIVNRFLTTQGQVSAVGTIVSSGYGFICGAYMPIAQFSSGLQHILMFLPGTYGTSLIRNHALRGAFSAAADAGLAPEVIDVIKKSIDCRLSFFGTDVSLPAMFAVLCGGTVLLIALFVLLNILCGVNRRKNIRMIKHRLSLNCVILKNRHNISCVILCVFIRKENMLNIKHLTKTYGSKKAVDDLSLHIAPGEIYGFIGHNGAGKTTTLKSCVGILQFDAGEILVNGTSVRKDPLTCKKLIAYIPDNPDMYEFMTGIKYLNFIADIFGIGAEERVQRINKYADMFELTASLAQPVSSYSHGMKQKLAVIAAWIHSPKLIIMDEPFVGLDPKAAHTLKGLMREVCNDGGAIFFSTHVLEVAEKLCDKVAIIKGGRLIRSGTMDEVKGDESLESVFLELEAE